jgi:hypothetical protein
MRIRKALTSRLDIAQSGYPYHQINQTTLSLPNTPKGSNQWQLPQLSLLQLPSPNPGLKANSSQPFTKHKILSKEEVAEKVKEEKAALKEKVVEEEVEVEVKAEGVMHHHLYLLLPLYWSNQQQT